MPVTDHRAPGAMAFPVADHFPLGRLFGSIARVVEEPSPLRPFGLTLAVRPREVITVDRSAFRYDDALQRGEVRQGDGFVPLAKHTDGTTKTVTDGGDGQHTNKDSDSDERED